jgi:hypothetical protein
MLRKLTLAALASGFLAAVMGKVADPASHPVEWENNPTTTLMWQYVSSANIDSLKEMIEGNAAVVNMRSEDGRGPLWWAYEYKQQEIIDLLIENGAPTDATDGDGFYPRDLPQSSYEYIGKLTKFREEKYQAEYEEAEKARGEIEADDDDDDDNDDDDDDDDDEV